jgi:hypothetical protein
VRGKPSAADLAFAGDTCARGAPVFVDDANVKGWNGKTEVAAAGDEGELDTQHGQAAKFDHTVAVQQDRGNSPASRQTKQGSELPKTLASFGWQVVAGGEPYPNAGQLG